MPEVELAPAGKLTVLVFDYAGISARVRSRAEQEAAYILDKSGLKPKWIDCVAALDPNGNPAECKPPFPPGALYLRIVGQPLAHGSRLPASALGFTSLETGSGGEYAGIFYDRVMESAAVAQADIYLVLGCVFAHEIGHMLLGPGSHTLGGIMRAQWSREDLVQAGERQLRFSREQSERLRSAFEARNRSSQTAAATGELSIAANQRGVPEPEGSALVRFSQHRPNPLCSDAGAIAGLRRPLTGLPVNANAPGAYAVFCDTY